MIKFETLEVAGGQAAIHGMRHPLQSYDKADSFLEPVDSDFRPGHFKFIIGQNDYDLAKRLAQAGSPEHAKFLRMINVGVDITADRGWWQEYATYKIGTTENSHSTMHTLLKTGVQKEDFNFPGGATYIGDESLTQTIQNINYLIGWYNEYKDEGDYSQKENVFRTIKGLLPESYMQTRTCHLNYQVLQNMYKQRKFHRLPQGNTDFTSWVKTLPYSEFITREWND